MGYFFELAMGSAVTALTGLMTPTKCRRSVPVTYLMIALGGAAGAVARYVVDVWVTERLPAGIPWGTFVINVTGALALGILASLVIERTVLPPATRPLAMIGFIGSYTTFSTWMLESWRLVETGAWATALLYVIGSVVFGFGAVGFGVVFGRLLP